MEKVLLVVFSLLSLCAAEGYFEIELSPSSVASVEFEASHISVWEHAKDRGRYFGMPLVCLQPERTGVFENIFTSRVQLDFRVVLWSDEAREAVYRHLKTHVNGSIGLENVELLPMERIRLIWTDRDQPLPDYYRLVDLWRANTHLPTSVTFTIMCEDLSKCQALERGLKARPEIFNGIEMEYVISAQRSASRRVTVRGSHLVGGDLYTKLTNMPALTPVRYLTSNDVKRLTAETVTNVMSSLVTDEDYVSTADETTVSELLQRVFEQDKVTTDNFNDQMWNSVFWEKTNARPDRITKYLNRIITRDANNSNNLVINQNERSTSAEAHVSGFFGAFAASGAGSSRSSSNARKEDVQSSLRENDLQVEWSGERFIVKPQQLARINLSRLNTSAHIVSTSVQVRRYESVQSIRLRPRCVQNRTTSLTPQLVQLQQRMRQEITPQLVQLQHRMRQEITPQLVQLQHRMRQEITPQLVQLQHRMRQEMSALRTESESTHERLESTLMERMTDELNEAQTQSLRHLLSNMPAIPEFCYIQRHECYAYIKNFKIIQPAELSGCKTSCRNRGNCTSFLHRRNTNKCSLLPQICPIHKLDKENPIDHPTDRYYVRTTSVPIQWNMLSVLRSLAMNGTPPASQMCSLLFGEGYQSG